MSGCGCVTRSIGRRGCWQRSWRRCSAVPSAYPDAVIPGYTHMRRAQAVLVAALSAGVLRNVRARFRAAAAGPRASERDAARQRRAGRQRISVRPRGHGARSGIRGGYQQQHGCLGRPRFRARFSVRRVDHDAAPEPAGRGLDPLLQRGVRLAGTGRRRHQRVEPDAAEEESRFAGADPRQVRPRVRRLARSS